MLVNGMMVDLAVITCVIQGWGLNLRLGRLVFAPGSLTQLEMDRFYAGDGASMYVVDRMQMVTKFVVMCYIASAAIPLLNWVVLLVLTISIFIDETNLLRVLYPAPQSDEAVVKCILVFVMPLAVLIHLLAARYASPRAPRHARRPVQPRLQPAPRSPGRNPPHACLLGASSGSSARVVLTLAVLTPALLTVATLATGSSSSSWA